MAGLGLALALGHLRSLSHCVWCWATGSAHVGSDAVGACEEDQTGGRAKVGEEGVRRGIGEGASRGWQGCRGVGEVSAQRGKVGSGVERGPEKRARPRNRLSRRPFGLAVVRVTDGDGQSSSAIKVRNRRSGTGEGAGCNGWPFRALMSSRSQAFNGGMQGGWSHLVGPKCHGVSSKGNAVRTMQRFGWRHPPKPLILALLHKLGGFGG